MDRKSILIVVACIALLVGGNVLINKLFPPVEVPVPPQTTNTVTQASEPASQESAVSPAATTPSLAASAAPPVVTETNVPEQTLVVTNALARYTFTSHGGALKQVELIGVATPREKKSGKIPVLNTAGTLPALTLIGGDLQAGGVFELTETATGVRASKQLPGGLVVIKDLIPTSNYLVSVNVRLENHSEQPLLVPEQRLIIGTATPLSSGDIGLSEGVFWSNGSDAEDISAGWFANKTLGCFPGTPRLEYREGQSNVVWAAAHNQFFTMVAMPSVPANQFYARSLNLPPPSAEELATNSRAIKEPKGYEASLIYAATQLAPGQAIERKLELYAGPKEYKTLSLVAGSHNDIVDTVMGFGGMFGGFFGFFSKILLLSMNALHDLVSLPYGWCIIAITVIIKLLFWPLTAASTRSMKRMAALQPQMKAIADKYKDDPVKRNQKTMEFMRENKVNPLGGCLPMLLQMPVFIGFFYMIRSAIELRGATFLWVPDLSQPDTLFTIPGINFPFNLLPILMGATMLWQAHLTPPSPGMDPMQQKIMKYMPLMFMVFLYNYSSGLALYWTVNNLLTILQTKLTRTNTPATATPAPAPVLTRPQKKKK